jgi:hypothetical protein
MNIGKFASCIRQAPSVFVWVTAFQHDGIYIQVPKTSARLILDEARQAKINEIEADMRSDGLYIG